jgi:DNA-binding MarR family transcriptional regulator
MDRSAVIAELLGELDASQPMHFMRHLRKWPGGALSLVHLQVLFTLSSDGPLPMRRLAEAMDVSQASATGIVDRMEQRGLVERLRDDEDRRVVRVALADGGRETLSTIATERRERLTAILGELEDAELEGFLAGLRGMRRGREALHAQLQDATPATHTSSATEGTR